MTKKVAVTTCRGVEKINIKEEIYLSPLLQAKIPPISKVMTIN